MNEYVQKHAIDLKNTEQYILSIRLRPDGFSFYIYNPLVKGAFFYKQIIFNALNEYTDSFMSAVYAEDVLLKEYKKIYVVHASPSFTFVPAGWCEDGTVEQYYSFCFPEQNDQVMSDKLADASVENIFGVDKTLFLFIDRTFGQVRHVHHLSALCEYFSMVSRRGNTSKAIVHIGPGVVDVLCYNRRGLLFANTFSFVHPDDAVYYILNVWQQQAFDQENDELYIVGDKELTRQIKKRLKEYIGQILPVIFPSEMYSSAENVRDIPFDLIILPLCEL